LRAFHRIMLQKGRFLSQARLGGESLAADRRGI
jgi:hypothetical protein